MEQKKNPNADLEKKRTVFFQIGLIVVIALVLIAFEWTSKPEINTDLADLGEALIEEEVVPITRQQEIPEQPPPQQVIEDLEIVDNEEEIKDEIEIKDDGADDNTEFEILEVFEEEEEAAVEEVFIIVEDMPLFNGKEAQEGFREYIRNTLEYPAIAAENGISGKVLVQFAVDKTGSVVDVVLLRGVHPALDKEALRVVRSSPKWTPGKQRGRAVKVQFVFPISFVLQQ